MTLNSAGICTPRLRRRAAALACVAAAALVLSACANTTPPGEIGSSTRGPVISDPPQVAPEKTSYAFEPFTGAPGNIADSLASDIGTEARAQGLTLVRRVGAPATYRVNGYLSATGDQSSVTLFYVFDVVDNAGNRVHRIVGQESAEGTSGDPWSGIDGDTLTRTAKRTVAALRAWTYR
ncbi:hypothetical protein [Hongsoonwoonella zoysiae]|uniref:hypothetical protein n=1 Tax=Hongsoonwoonella zoysiae TaxID=2821844 RepID=UPI001AEE4054|nr:hypothetical protein [Hongsoonwoonella zoysiae]